MDNLAYPEFKQMILHFRRFQGRVPTLFLWTRAIDQMAQKIMDDFDALQAQRTGDLDRRGLGLSPALLEEFCMVSHSLKQLFLLLEEELQNQWTKADMPAEPSSAFGIENFEWRMHSVRQTLLFHVKDPVNQCKVRGDWPEVPEPREHDDQDDEDENKWLPGFVRAMLQDEEILNMALENCPHDYSHQHEKLKYRLQIELAPDLLKLESDATISSALAKVFADLRQTWHLAWNTEDDEMQSLLESKEPTSYMNTMRTERHVARRQSLLPLLNELAPSSGEPHSHKTV